MYISKLQFVYYSWNLHFGRASATYSAHGQNVDNHACTIEVAYKNTAKPIFEISQLYICKSDFINILNISRYMYCASTVYTTK